MTYSDGKEEALSERLEQKGDHRFWHRVGGQDGASACEPCREAIEVAPSRGSNFKASWQDSLDTDRHPRLKRLK